MPKTIGEGGPEPIATIEVRVNHHQQRFNSLDPSPFYERDLDQDAEEYIVDSADAASPSSCRRNDGQGGYRPAWPMRDHRRCR